MTTPCASVQCGASLALFVVEDIPSLVCTHALTHLKGLRYQPGLMFHWNSRWEGWQLPEGIGGKNKKAKRKTKREDKRGKEERERREAGRESGE